MTYLLTPAEAYTIASQHGSFMNAADPGRVFYTLHVGDARPVSEDHRHELLTYATARHVAALLGGDRASADELEPLIHFFTVTPLRPAQAAA